MRALLSLLLVVLSSPLAATEGPSLLLPGTYHAAELDAANGEAWLALVARESGDAVVTTRIAVAPVRDPLYGDGAADARRVSTPGLDGDALFLVRAIAGVAPGKLVTVVGEPRYLPQDAPVRMFLGSAEQNRLDLACTAAGADGASRCTLYFARGERRQDLAEFAARAGTDGRLHLADDAAPALLWSGDLDRDGRIDLLLDLGAHYNVSAPTLFLSTRAAAGELLGRTAVRRRSAS